MIFEILMKEPILWIIALCSVISLGITLERWRTMRKADTDSEGLLGRVSEALSVNDVEEAIAQCDRAGGPVGETLAIGLRKLVLLERLGKRPEELEEGVVAAMEEHGLHVVSFLERNLSTLATMASLAPILGMLGTVIGMIIEFQKLKVGGASSGTEGLSKGISMALNCTAGGLIVAAMATVEYNYFAARVNRFSLQVQGAATRLVDRLLHDQSNKLHGIARKDSTTT